MKIRFAVGSTQSCVMSIKVTVEKLELPLSEAEAWLGALVLLRSRAECKIIQVFGCDQ